MSRTLLLPRNIVAERKEMAQVLDAESQDAVLEAQVHISRYWNPILKGIDQRMELVWVGGQPGQDLGQGLVGCRWHVRINRNDGADIYMPCLAPDGGYRTPDSRFLDELNERRMDSPGFMQREAGRRAKRAAEVERREEAKRAEIREELALRLKSKLAPSMNFDADRKWRNRLGEPERKEG